MGSQDHLFLPPAKSYAALHPNADISVIQDCGHVVSIEQAEQFNHICLDFLAKKKKRAVKPAFSKQQITP